MKEKIQVRVIKLQKFAKGKGYKLGMMIVTEWTKP